MHKRKGAVLSNGAESRRTTFSWRRGDSNPGPRQDRPQRLRACSTDWGLQPLASGQPTSGQVF